MTHIFKAYLTIFMLLYASTANSAPVEVDVQLVLGVDVSRSMSPGELEIQRRGYAQALTSEAVFDAIQSGLLGRIAITYIEWGGAYHQQVVIDWQLIETRADLEVIAAQLTAKPPDTFSRTSISEIIKYATKSIEENGFTSLRKVIDISGDGPNNDGIPVLDARKIALEKGITINGLPLMTREGPGQLSHLDDLDKYYESCVIGGPGSFVIAVRQWPEFLESVRKKLVLELAGLTPQPNLLKKANFTRNTIGDYDCLIGEKIWRDLLNRIPPGNILP